MLAEQLTDSEKRKEIRRLERMLEKRVKNIEQLGDTVPQIATQKFREFQATRPKNLSKVEGTDLTSLYRQLRYINQLKTSRVKGAKQAQQYYERIFDRIDDLSEQLRTKIWNAYEKMREHNPYLEHFKYEVLETLVDTTLQGVDNEELVGQMIDSYDEILEAQGSNITDEKLKVLFTDRLRDLRK